MNLFMIGQRKMSEIMMIMKMKSCRPIMVCKFKEMLFLQLTQFKFNHFKKKLFKTLETKPTSNISSFFVKWVLIGLK